MEIIAIIVILMAFFFTFTNGLNDSASQVATIISSRTLQPETALILAAIGNFIGAYFLGTSVAKTISKNIIDPTLIQYSASGAITLFSALTGAIGWNLGSWWLGLPSSSSHALIGGLLGAFMAGWGLTPIYWSNIKILVIAMLLSPLLSFGLTYLMTKFIFFIAQWLPRTANPWFQRLQILTLLFQSLAHGSNDTQKSMGVIMFALMILQLHSLPSADAFSIPNWVILSCGAVISLGILTGGWKIIRTIGAGLYRVRTIHGFTAQTSASLIMILNSWMGFPVSTTQIITSSVMGAGAAFRPKAVRWEVAKDMVVTWLITIPTSALIAAVTFKILRKVNF